MQSKTKIVRYPRLDTLMMIENAAEDAKGDYTVRQIWQRLPKKVMWQTYLTAIDYLEKSYKIIIDKKTSGVDIESKRSCKSKKTKTRGKVLKEPKIYFMDISI